MSRQEADSALSKGYLTPAGHAYIQGQHDTRDALTPQLQGQVNDAQRQVDRTTGADLRGKTSAETLQNVAQRQQEVGTNEVGQEINIQKEHEATSTALQQRKADLFAQALADKAAQDAKNEQLTQQAQADNAKLMVQHDAQVKQLISQKVDPEKYWHDQNIGQRIMTGLSMMLGGFVAGRTHTDNQALKLVQQGIDASVKAQMADMENKRSALNDEGQGLRDRVQLAQSNDVHRQTLAAQGYQTAILTLQNQLSREPDPDRVAQGKLAIAQLEQKRDVLSTSAAQQYAQVQMSHERTAAALAAHQQSRAEAALDEERKTQNSIREKGAQGAVDIDVNAAKGAGGPKGPAANLATAVTNLEGFRNKDGSFDDTGVISKRLPNAVVPERTVAQRAAVDEVALAYAKQIGIRLDKNDPTGSARRALFHGREDPTTDQLTDVIQRSKNLSKNKNLAPGGSADPAEAE